MSGPRRKLWVPEVVQTSAMDCGPAALSALCGGFDLKVSYGRLREACQTGVDGTSIDVLEEVANKLGLEAEQTVVPFDHVLLDEAEALPAIAVVCLPSGLTHFVVLWRRHGNWVQLMDPAVGRRFVHANDLMRELYRHDAPVPESAFLEFAASDGFLAPLGARLARMGVDGSALLQEAASQPGVRGHAALDAALRFVSSLVQSGAVSRGDEAKRLLETFYRRALAEPKFIPTSYQSLSEGAPVDGEPMVTLSGAVLVRVVERKGSAEAEQTLTPELRAALTEPTARPARMLWREARRAAPWLWVLLLLGFVAAAGAGLLEALLLRGLLEIGRDLPVLSQRLVGAAQLVSFLVLVLLLEWPLRLSVRALGRALETQVRVAFLEKIPRLPDRYFASRPTSDMAERAHALHRLRQVTELSGQLVRTGTALLATTVGLVWLDPRGAWLALAGLAVSVAVPALSLRWLEERDLRFRSHGGAIFRFYLDALLGLLAVRSHAAERSVRREHEALLVDWVGAGRNLQRAAVFAEATQGLFATAVAGALLFGYLGRAGEVGGVLLYAYWALELPGLGHELAVLLRRVPPLRNTMLRALEPLGAPESASPDAPPLASSATQATALTMEGVSVVAGGNPVLSDVNLTIDAGSHVAIVGPSGSGKSSLVGLLLGFHGAHEGRVLVDGQPLDAAALAALRAHTAWLDPGVQLWNRSLLENLRYGADEEQASALDRVIEQAALGDVVERLPEGLGTSLGENGGLVSGGEGQRVRLARAFTRGHARLVILDEPFRGLDRAVRHALLSRVREHFRDATLLCITHDVRETAAFARVLVLDQGRVVEDGAPGDLASDESTLYATMIAAERTLDRNVWGHPAWRRLSIDDGELREATADAGGAS